METCPACGCARREVLFRTTDRLYRTTDRLFDVVECAGCKLVRLYPWPQPAELSGYYPDNYWYAPGTDAASTLEERYRRFVLRDHLRFVLRAFEHTSRDGPILDVGCGGGLFLKMVAERGMQVLGLDYSAEAAAVAWWRNGVPAVAALLPEAPLPPHSCALITMYHVLEHLYEPGRYLEAARELLRPGGRLVVQTPNAACWQFLLFGENWNGIDVPRHLIDFREAHLVSLLESCKFDVVCVKHFSLRDNPAGFASSLAPALDPMARRVRRIRESPALRLTKDFTYFGLLLAGLPFTILEALCRAGSTVMIEARPRT
jgi:SAM-dependent methyltransferase